MSRRSLMSKLVGTELKILTDTLGDTWYHAVATYERCKDDGKPGDRTTITRVFHLLEDAQEFLRGCKRSSKKKKNV